MSLEVYTVIRYEFGNTHLVYTGLNKERVTAMLHAHEYNYLHVWKDGQEIRYEGRGTGADNADYLLNPSTVRTIRTRLNNDPLPIECVDIVHEKDILWVECEYNGEVRFEFSLQRQADNSFSFTLGLEEELVPQFHQIDQFISDVTSDLLEGKVIIKNQEITALPLALNPYA